MRNVKQADCPPPGGLFRTTFQLLLMLFSILTIAACAVTANAAPTIDDRIQKRAPLPAKKQKPLSAWPSKLFAPYVDITMFPKFNVADVAATTGSKFYTLAFVTGDKSGNPKWGPGCNFDKGYYNDVLTSLRSSGGDAIISIGGASGPELAVVAPNEGELQMKYQAVINKYDVTRLDIDIEGAAVANTKANDRRSKALVGLKAANPGLIISLTFAALPTGLTAEGLAVLQSAKKAGLQVDVVNVMAMDYGPSNAPNGSTAMGHYAIEAAKATYAQVQSVGLTATIGVTPMPGQNDLADEIFTLENAAELVQFAQSTPWVSFLSFWSANRDQYTAGAILGLTTNVTQNKFDYINAFKGFTSV